MNKGFTIRCANCGNEVKFASEDSNIVLTHDQKYDVSITELECKCGNEANSHED